MFHPRLNSVHWSCALFLLTTFAMGCAREAPVNTEATNEARDAFGPRALSVEDNAAHPATGVEPIYDVDADGAEQIAAALEGARREHKHVLLQWGDNHCAWCYKLHDLFKSDDQVRPLVYENYELVLLEGEVNESLMKGYVGADQDYTFPHLTILDAEGNVLVNQNTEILEDGSRHDPAKVGEFLGKWTPEPVDAETLLASTLEHATAADKRVLMHVGTPYCGWCHVLSRFLHDHESQFASDYIDLKIDTMRMTHGEDVAARFQPEGSQGVPWMVILDASGKVLATSVGPDGNCGYPYQPQEIDHFISMLSDTRQQMTDDDLAVIRSDLAAYREAREEN